MKILDIKQIAQTMGIPLRRMAKAELIRAIQSKEGNVPCFETRAATTCGQEQCLWRPDCK